MFINLVISFILIFVAIVGESALILFNGLMTSISL